MPHDCKGRKIEIGDWVKAPPYNYVERRKPTAEGESVGKAYPVVGRVTAMREGQSCSGDFAWLSPFNGMRTDAFGADQAELVLKADGSEPTDG
jgi:hypothetical protein